jgi:ankyrin repeat protein
MRKWFKYALYLVVYISYSAANSGSFDDFFNAVRQDNEHVVRALLQRGFDPNTIAPNGETGLILAVREPAFKVVGVLLDSPLTRVNLRTVNDESALMLAALKGYFEVCKTLIARDADVNKPGWTPLHYAATGGHVAIVQLLLDSNAYIDAASPNESTPLMMAAKYGSSEVVKLLLDSGADPAIKNMLGLTAMDFAKQVQRDYIVTAIETAIQAKRK